MKDKILRKYIYSGPGGASDFIGIVNRMSFGIWNIDKPELLSTPPVRSLFHEDERGTVKVTRIGHLELVRINALGGEVLVIILTNDSDHTFIVALGETEAEEIGESISDKSIAGLTYHDQTYHASFYDQLVETCNNFFSMDDRTFQAQQIGSGSYRQDDIKDDWHYSKYVVRWVAEQGQEVQLYYLIGVPIDLSHTGNIISFSMSPYTYTQEHSHIARHIDQDKRTYRPYFKNADLSPSLVYMADFADLPYGKKPFTRDANGNVTRSKEVVTSGGITFTELNMRHFWPWIPYMHEIPYLNIQDYTKWNIFKNGGIFEMDYAASLESHDINWDGGQNEDVRSDSGSIFEGPQNENVVTPEIPRIEWDYPEPAQKLGGSVCGTWNYSDDITKSWNSACTKSETVGTVGELKDLHITHDLSISGSRTYHHEQTVNKTTNFPSGFYIWWSGTEDTFWPNAIYHDESDGVDSATDHYESTINLTTKIKVGDVVIDEGVSMLSYSLDAMQTISQESTIDMNKTDNPNSGCSIAYTTQSMGVGQSQNLAVDGAYDGPFVWELASGGGSLTVSEDGKSAVYTAPDTNAGCLNNPTIVLRAGTGRGCDDVIEGGELEVCDSLSIAINIDTNNYEAVRKVFIEDGSGGCAWGISRQAYRCDSTIQAAQVGCYGCGGVTPCTPECSLFFVFAGIGAGNCPPGSNWNGSFGPPAPCTYPDRPGIMENCLASDGCGLSAKGYSGCELDNYDWRTPAQIQGGCCPEMLL